MKNSHNKNDEQPKLKRNEYTKWKLREKNSISKHKTHNRQICWNTHRGRQVHQRENEKRKTNEKKSQTKTLTSFTLLLNVYLCCFHLQMWKNFDTIAIDCFGILNLFFRCIVCDRRKILHTFSGLVSKNCLAAILRIFFLYMMMMMTEGISEYVQTCVCTVRVYVFLKCVYGYVAVYSHSQAAATTANSFCVWVFAFVCVRVVEFPLVAYVMCLLVYARTYVGICQLMENMLAFAWNSSIQWHIVQCISLCVRVYVRTDNQAAAVALT